MGKVDDIIRRYAETKDSIEGFGPWLLSERDSSEKEDALSGLWRRLEATPAADNAFLRRAKLSALMKRIPREEAVSSSRHWLWMLPVAAAAALGLLLLLPHTEDNRSRPNTNQPLAQVIEEVPVIPDDSQVVEKSEPAPVLAQVAPSPPSIKVSVLSPSCSPAVAEDGRPEPFVPIDGVVVESEEALVSESEKESPSSGSSPKLSVDDPLTESKEDKTVVSAQWAELEREDRLEGQKKNRPLSVGLQSSGGLLASVSSRSMTFMLGQVIGYGENGEVFESQYIESLPEGELTEKTRHDVPFRAGVSIFLPLNGRFSFGTGLTFTLLHFNSSLSSSSSSAFISKDARYRCLGVPLMVRYQFSSGDWGSFYGTAGVEADYLLKGWSTVRKSDNDPDVYNVGKHSLQFSTRFGVGYEYFIYRRWNIYTEASLDYYFNNESSLGTYFRQQPLTPSITLGVHYTLSR